MNALRDPFIDPRAGDIIDTMKLYGGCRIRVVTRGFRWRGKNKQDSVHVRILQIFGGGEPENRGRVWSLATWTDVCTGAELVARGDA